MPRPISAVIHLKNFTHNLSVVRKHVGLAKIWSVMKADAYGHSIEQVWQALSATDGFAILDLNEAILLRDKGWNGPILLLEGFFQSEDLEVINQYQLTTAIHSNWQLDAIDKMRTNSSISVYAKLNSGMNRLGFKSCEYAQVIKRLISMHNVDAITLMTHFANSDVATGTDSPHQTLKPFIDGSLPICAANSGAILWHPDTHYDWVRSGIILYGASPSGKWQDIADKNLRATMTLQSKIIAIHDINSNESIGYGSKFTANKPLRIATVACGYADGYPRHAPTGTPVWLKGTRCSLLGAVSMDMLTIDVSEVPTAEIDDTVELWGQNLPVDDVAEAAGTIGYELMCALAKRVPVIYEK